MGVCQSANRVKTGSGEGFTYVTTGRNGRARGEFLEAFTRENGGQNARGSKTRKPSKFKGMVQDGGIFWLCLFRSPMNFLTPWAGQRKPRLVRPGLRGGSSLELHGQIFNVPEQEFQESFFPASGVAMVGKQVGFLG